MELTREDIKNLRNIDGLPIDEATVLIIKKELAYQESYRKRIETVKTLMSSGVPISNEWLRENILCGRTIEETEECIDKIENKIEELLVGKRNDKIDSIVDENNGESGHND